MTIAALVCDPPYVLVAAERRWRHPITGEQGEHIKVHVHPYLPAVWVAAGAHVNGPLEDLCDQRSVQATAAEVSRLVAQQTDWFLGTLSVLIGGLGVLLTSNDILVRHPPITAAYWHSFSGADYTAREIPPGGHLCASPNTEAFFRALPDSAFPPPRGSHPRDIAKHLRQLIKNGIAAAREIAGDDADCGGYVDVAIAGPPGGIAGPRGARIL